MMRYHQRVSPDALTPLSNGRRSNSHSGEGKGLPRFRSPSKAHDQNSSHFDAAGDAPSSPTRSENNHQHQRHQYETTPTRNLGNENNSPSRNGGDVLLQWGHRKRSRCSRTEIRLATDESMHLQSRQAALKVQRREVQPQQTPTSAPALASVDKPPTPPPVSCTISSAAAAPPSNGKRCTGVFTNRRSLEERRSAVNVNGCQRSNGGSSSSRRFSSSRSVVGKRSPTPTQKLDRKAPSCGPARDHKWNGASLDQEEAAAAAYETNHADTAPQQLQPQAASTTHAHNNTANAISGEMVEWPRIYIALTRKEKEDDFLAMKGTKLPHRPKKRAKNVDKSLQFCFPGMWLSDLTRGRYEVREKKCGKKQKRRGLKGMMESMESDSEG